MRRATAYYLFHPNATNGIAIFQNSAQIYNENLECTNFWSKIIRLKCYKRKRKEKIDLVFSNFCCTFVIEFWVYKYTSRYSDHYLLTTRAILL